MPTAKAIIVGNEILTGRTQDANLGYLAGALTRHGVTLSEAVVVPDERAIIADRVQRYAAEGDYVFTSGGIGATHDDVTSQAVAEALGLPFVRNTEAEACLRAHYGDAINAQRLKMADMPAGVTLVPNPVTGAPGFRVENVYVLAGVPSIFQRMLDAVLPQIAQGTPWHTVSVETDLGEGNYAAELERLQSRFKTCAFGSYPHFRPGAYTQSIVVRGPDAAVVERAGEAVRRMLERVARNVGEAHKDGVHGAADTPDVHAASASPHQDD